MTSITRTVVPRRYSPTVGWVLLPLRAFLGATFVFAGLQKLADPNFLDPHAASGIHEQLVAAIRRSPIGGTLGSLVGHATVVGLLIAFAELAIGVGALLGLWTRIAAIGGVVVSLGFLLAVSWHTHPYYLGSDVVFVFAWTPLVVAGAPDRLSLDTYFARRARRDLRVAPSGRVDIEFAAVRSLCGSYDHGRCERLRGAHCEPGHCPVLLATPRLRPDTAREVDRREFLGAARAAGMLAVAGGVVAAGTAVIGRALHSPSRRSASALSLRPSASTTTAPAGVTTSPTTAAPPPPGTAIGPASALPVGRAGTFTDPYSGQPAIALQSAVGRFRCFSAVCPHAGCTVGYDGSRFVCPCHGAEFDATNGAVLAGPADAPLASIPIAAGPDGQLYVTS